MGPAPSWTATKAADQGDAAAQFNSGCMYEKGWGVEQSDVNAVQWYTKAADQGHAKARRCLEILFK